MSLRGFVCILTALATMPVAAVFADVPGDVDGDLDIDIDDFEVYGLCQFGPDNATFGPCQDWFDFDFDSDVDLTDFATLQVCFSGANLPADPDCAPHSVRIEGGCLRIIGTAANTVLALRLRAGDSSVLEIDVHNDGSAEFSANRTDFACIVVFARGGNDEVIIDEINGVFTDTEFTTIDGGDGNDTLRGGSGPETFYGGDGSDLVIMGGDRDHFIWMPGDDSDVIEGGDGNDLVEITGDSLSEQFTVTANGTRVRFDRLNLAPFALDIGTCEQLLLVANDGNDSFACTGNLAALIQIIADGGRGDDTLLGSNGADSLRGGDDNDFIDGQQGNDLVFLGPGDDTFQWDPGDGSDTVDGQSGSDRVLLNGSAAQEIFEFTANAGRVRFTRNIGNIVMDLDEIETFDLRALGNTDTININDLTGTELTLANVNLAGTVGGSGGDAAADNIVVNATSGDDVVEVIGGPNSVEVRGVSPVVRISAAEAAVDRLIVNALGGEDELRATELSAGAIGLTFNGGTGDDLLVGSAGIDVLNGDDDNDTITGGPGNDQVFLGAGNDVFQWNPGDETDLIDGNDGIDTLEVNGDSVAEQFTVIANGARVRFDRLNPEPFALDIGSCEELLLNANDGDDSVSCTGNLAALIHITSDGGAGDDTLLGSNGSDVLIGGNDNDFIDGQQGNDVAVLGAGDDTFQWDPGDGSDTIEGQGGEDRLRFNGSNIAEMLEFSSIGARLRLTRNIGSIVMDVNGVETVDLRATGGADNIIVNNLAQTDVSNIAIDLLGTLGGPGDAAADTITVNGTPAADSIVLNAGGDAVEITGLSAVVRIVHSEAAIDLLTVNGLDGADSITVGPGVTGLIQVQTNP